MFHEGSGRRDKVFYGYRNYRSSTSFKIKSVKLSVISIGRVILKALSPAVFFYNASGIIFLKNDELKIMRKVSNAILLQPACHTCDSMTKRQTIGTALKHIWYFWISEAVGRLFICHYLAASVRGEKCYASDEYPALSDVCVIYEIGW